MNYRSKILLLSMCSLLQAACSSQAVYTGESFDIDSPFKMRTDSEVALACESARRALLGQGYIIENADSDGVKGRKAYRSESEKNTFIEMNIVCLPETTGSTLFANGLLSGYEVKKSASSASVGVSAIGSISLPIGQSADSLVKVSEETINDKDFYQRFFAAVGNILSEREANKVSPEPAEAPVVTELAPVLAPTASEDDLEAPALEGDLAAPEPAPPQEPGELPGQVVPATLPEILPAQESPIVVVPEPSPGQVPPAASTPEPPIVEEVPEEVVLEPFPLVEAPEEVVLEPFPLVEAPEEVVLEPFPEQVEPKDTSETAPTEEVTGIIPQPKSKPTLETEVPQSAPEESPVTLDDLF